MKQASSASLGTTAPATKPGAVLSKVEPRSKSRMVSLKKPKPGTVAELVYTASWTPGLVSSVFISQPSP